MNKHTALYLLDFVLGATLAGPVVADTTYLGAGGSVEKTVSSGSETLATDLFADTDFGWYSKLGLGQFVFPVANVRSPASVKVALRNGSLRLTPGSAPAATRPAVADAPSVIREKAAFWLDARTNLKYASEPSGTVSDWYDVRETAADIAAGTTKYPSAHAVQLWDESGIIYPKLAEDAADGNQYVNFNGVHASTAMKFSFPGEADPTGTVTGVQHIFLAHRMTTGVGIFWGMNAQSDAHYYPPGNYKGDWGAYLGDQKDNSGYIGTSHGTFWRDGVRINPLTERVTSARTEVLAFATHPQFTFAVGNFFCERHRYATKYEKRCGGDDIGESIVFTVPLTEAERLAVTDYLMARWRSGVAAGGIRVTAAAGSTLDVADATDAGTLEQVTVDGSANLRKIGSGTASVRNDFSRGSFVDRTRIEGGTLNLATAELTPTLAAGERLTASKDRWETLTLSSGSTDAGTVELAVTGDADCRLAQVPDGTEKIVVSAGRLTLGEKAPVETPKMASGDGVWATLENPGFENATTATGWTIMKGSSAEVSVQNYSNQTTANWRRPYWDADKPNKGAPEGGNVLLCRMTPWFVHTEINFPQTGVYELSFMAAMRADNQYTPSVADVLLFREGGSTTNVIARLKTYYNLGSYQRYVFRLPQVEAGKYRLGFRDEMPEGTKEQNVYLDDIQAKLVPDADPDERPVPCGDFERETYPDWQNTNLYALRTEIGATGWTLENNDYGKVQPYWPDVAVASSLTANGSYGRGLAAYGDRQLFFIGTNGTATCDAFSLAAGTYSLRFDAARSSRADIYRDKINHYIRGEAAFAVEVLVNDVVVRTVSSGTVSDYHGLTVTDTGSVTVKATDAIRLRVRQTAADLSTGSGLWVACGVVDNFRFVVKSSELVCNGSFEEATDWTYETGKDAVETYAKCSRYSLPQPAHYCSVACDGPMALLICQCGSARQTIDVPEAGWYRFSCWTCSRVDLGNDPTYLTRNFGGNQLKAWWCAEDGTGTNEFYRSPCILSTNFLKRTAYVKLPKGRIVFGLQGVNHKGVEQVAYSASDATLLVDAVSLKPVSAPTAPTALTDKKLDVAAGAKLRLDFDGTVNMQEVRLGGRRRSGVISAARFPEFVSGEGVINTPRRGFVMVVR